MKQKPNNVYMSFGRHGRYGRDTAIDRLSMLEAWLMGRRMNKALPNVEAIYHSPIARAVETARFRGAGLGCKRLLSIPQLSEEASAFYIRKFVNLIISDAKPEEYHFHFVSHLPVIEKLGLPALNTGEVCVCCADNWVEMLADNYKISLIPTPQREEVAELLDLINISSEELEKMSADTIFNLLQEIKTDCL